MALQPYYSITDWENEPSQKTAINRTNLLKMENGIKEGDNRLVQMDANKYNVPANHVIRHYDVTGKICPNPFVYNHTQHTWGRSGDSFGIQAWAGIMMITVGGMQVLKLLTINLPGRLLTAISIISIRTVMRSMVGRR